MEAKFAARREIPENIPYPIYLNLYVYMCAHEHVLIHISIEPLMFINLTPVFIPLIVPGKVWLAWLCN